MVTGSALLIHPVLEILMCIQSIIQNRAYNLKGTNTFRNTCDYFAKFFTGIFEKNQNVQARKYCGTN
jgi:hypothetical protein